MDNSKKIIVILGPTASGKTKLAVRLARKFNGEIVSADSRQVYKGLDIGTGKDLSDYKIPHPGAPLLIRRGAGDEDKIPYHLIDVASPKKQFDLAKYQKLAFAAIDDILKRGKLPILAGGSGLYLQAVVDNYKLAKVEKNLLLRKKLEKLNRQQLFERLKKLSPKLAAKLNQSDKKNKRRLIRCLEILDQNENFKNRSGERKYHSLIIGLNHPRDILKERIAKRLIFRLEKLDLISEVKGLRESGLSWKRLEDFGLEYKFVSWYLQKKFSYQEMVKKLIIASSQFSKRQQVWFKRWERQGAKIDWLKNKEDAVPMAREFLKIKNGLMR